MTLDIFMFGTVLAAFAGVSAYLIALHEMRRHFTSALQPRREALHSAMVTVVFFGILTGALAFVVPRIFSGT